MTDEEWWASETEEARWESDFAEGYASKRKYQLYAVACCRRIWSLFPHDCCRHVVETLERLAEGLCDECDLDAAGELFDSVTGTDRHAGLSQAQSYALSAAVTCFMDKENRLATVAESYCRAATNAAQRGAEAAEWDAQCAFLRDIYCNPCRPVSIEPSWLTPTVTGLAAVAYEERALPSGELDTACLAVLADALEETGCDNADILNHLRRPGPHVRGCWPLDLLLGKE